MAHPSGLPSGSYQCKPPNSQISKMIGIGIPISTSLLCRTPQEKLLTELQVPPTTTTGACTRPSLLRQKNLDMWQSRGTCWECSSWSNATLMLPLKVPRVSHQFRCRALGLIHLNVESGDRSECGGGPSVLGLAVIAELQAL